MCGIGAEAPYGNEDPTPLALANIYDKFIAESVSADLRRYFEAKLFFKKAYDTNITLAKQASSNLWVDGLANTLAVWKGSLCKLVLAEVMGPRQGTKTHTYSLTTNGHDPRDPIHSAGEIAWHVGSIRI